MNIVICDDDTMVFNKVRRCCLKNINEDINFYEYSDGQQMLEQLHNIREMDLFILDIEMPNINGIELRKLLERASYQCSIIYMTSHEEFMQEAFGRCVIGFVLKRRLMEDLTDRLTQFYWEWNENIKILIESTVGTKIVKKNDIVSIRSDRIYSLVSTVIGVTNDGALLTSEICVRKPLNEWESALGNEDFYRVHKSFIINFAYVVKLGSEVALKDGSRHKVSRGVEKAARMAYKQYCQKMARCM